MQTDDVTIRAQVQDGVWETFGSDRAITVLPESLVASSNEWGSDKASFDLRRKPSSIWPDLQAFTPIEVEVAGEVVWTGRISETPATDGDDPIINVQCEGWQYHLDDDVYAQNYVHTALNDWRDARTYPGVTLTRVGTAAGTVSSEAGSMVFGWPKGSVQGAGAQAYVGTVLDLGLYATAKRIVISYEWIARGNVGFFNFIVNSGNNADVLAFPTDVLTNVDITTMAASSTVAFTLPTARRYIGIGMWWTNAAGGATGEDDLIRITAVQTFANTAYESGNASILKANTVIADSLNTAPLLNSDQSQVAATTFSIPSFSFPKTPQTPREVVTAANAFHNYNTWIDVDGRMNFQPRPSAPLYEVGSWGGSQFQDSAMNSGQDVYNRVLATGNGPDGEPIIVESRAASQPGVALRAATLVTVANPSFTTGAAGSASANWTNVTQDTTNFDTSPASGIIPIYSKSGSPGGGNAANNVAVGATTGTFKKGTTYVLKFVFAVITGAFGRYNERMYAQFGSSTDYATLTVPSVFSPTGWVAGSLSWTPRADTSSVNITIQNATNGAMNIDSFALYLAAPTMVDRRGFKRTKILTVDAPMTYGVGTQLGGVFLQSHGTQPLKGALGVNVGGIRRHLTGEVVHPAHLLRSPGQNIRLSHRTDPDTGGQGRDGRMASVTYTHAERAAQVELDNDRRNFEALLARYSIIAGSRVQS